MYLEYLKYYFMKVAYTVLLLDMGMAGIAAQMWLEKTNNESD
jgi:hypothetical protein